MSPNFMHFSKDGLCSLKSVGGGSNKCLTLITQPLQKQELVIINISQIDINSFSVSKTSHHMFSFQKMLVNLLLKMSILSMAWIIYH